MMVYLRATAFLPIIGSSLRGSRYSCPSRTSVHRATASYQLSHLCDDVREVHVEIPWLQFTMQIRRFGEVRPLRI